MTLRDLLHQGAPIDAIAAHLDPLDHAGRIAALGTLASADFERLYKAASGQHVDLDFYVPPSTPPNASVEHVGLNSMPLFRTVDKRFVRTEAGDLQGYNHLANPVASAFSGPGYFTVQARSAPCPDGRTDTQQLFVNYYRVPAGLPHADWPQVRNNEGFPGSLVYGRMCDYMWRVSQHVSIGEAWRAGKTLRTWFAISRRDT